MNNSTRYLLYYPEDANGSEATAYLFVVPRAWHVANSCPVFIVICVVFPAEASAKSATKTVSKLFCYITSHVSENAINRAHFILPLTYIGVYS